jgi:prolipoprotein diacylglyceryltransferase
MFPILQVGPLAVQLPGLFLLVGVWVGSAIVEREAPKRGLSGAVLSSMLFFGLVAGLLGARLGYALRYWTVYAEDPLGLVSLNPNTLSAAEGVAAALLVSLVLARRHRLPLWSTLDAFAPGLAAFAVFAGLADLSSGDAFGAPTSLPWAIELWGAERHPSQVYTILLAAAVFVIVRRLSLSPAFSGFLFLAWLALAAASRLFLEAFRGDSAIVLGLFRSAQLISLIVLGAALLGLNQRARVAQTAEGKTGDSG